MKTFKFFWTAHKWTGIVLALWFVLIACTGFLLLIKKNVDWIQPPTQEDAAGEIDDFISTQDMLQIVFDQDHPDFQFIADIDRVDFRPKQRVFKVRSRHHLAEIQVGAVSGDILSIDDRPSDLIETIHDGSFFADFVHVWLMPIVACSLIFLAFSGLWLWLEPIIRRRRRKRKHAEQAVRTGRR